MTNSPNAAFAEPWRLLWNGDLTLTDQIIHPDFVAHAAPITGGAAGDMKGRETLNSWVSGINALIPDLAPATRRRQADSCSPGRAAGGRLILSSVPRDRGRSMTSVREWPR